MPPPVRALDTWLSAYALGDREKLVERTSTSDQALLAKGLAEAAKDPTGTLALALPPRPLDHSILEVVKKGAGRQVISARLVLPNPLPSASERVGQPLPGVPETRPLRRRFLVIEEAEAWVVKLDLERVVERSRIATEVLGLIAEGRLAEADRRLLEGVPAPPDDGESGPAQDRLLDELRRRILEAEGGRTKLSRPAPASESQETPASEGRATPALKVQESP